MRATAELPIVATTGQPTLAVMEGRIGAATEQRHVGRADD
jgi:hypothetical protein